MDLVAFSTMDTSALRWVRLAPDRSEYELRSEETPLARLTWGKERAAPGTAATAGATWTVRREGFLRPRLHLRQDGAAKDAARVVPHADGVGTRHAIELPDGSRYGLTRAGLAVPAWTLVDESGAELAHIEPIRDGRHLLGGTYEVEGPIAKSPALPLLILLSWYFIALSWFEDEAVSEWTDHAEARF